MKNIKILIALFAWMLFAYAYTQNFHFLENINNKFTDILFSLRGVEKASSKIVIVDVDEKSLTNMKGFSRDKLAKIIDNLTNADASIIGIGMAFPRKDQSSPKIVLAKLGMDIQNAKDYDEILSSSLKKSFVVGGYIFDFNSGITKGKTPNIPFVMVQKGHAQNEYLPEAKGVISNIDLFQNSFLSNGFINMIPDEDGVTRSVPLVIKYKDEIYPSLSLEIVRNFLKKQQITVEYSNAGINSVSLDKYVISTDRFGRLMVNFKGISKSYKHISASDLYAGDFKKELIKDKIVLIGASTSRFHDLRVTPFDCTVSGIEVHANAIDNILNNNFLAKPNFIEFLDISLLFIIIFALVVFSMYGAIKNTILSTITIFGFFVLAFLLFTNFGLILNIVFPLVGGFILYSLLTSLHYINEVKLKNNINKKLITEMQNRQDIIQGEVIQKTQELQKALEEKTVLLRELHHRVKNNLQLILSIIRLQQYELKDKKTDEEFGKLQNRIKSIAKTHEILCDSNDISNVDMSEYVGELCEEMESGLIYKNIEINIDVEATLPPREAVYIGLVINEIVSNSIKHAFGEEGGEVYIYLAKIKEEYILRISDNGKGYDGDFLKNKSLGLKLVDALIVNQLEGSMKVESNKHFGYIIKFKHDEK